MKKRSLYLNGPEVTECGAGCWQLGGGWGRDWNDAIAQDILQTSYDSGVRFFDTADVYDNGESELSVGRFRRTHPDIFVATKLGRGMGMYPDGYTRDSLKSSTEASLATISCASRSKRPKKIWRMMVA